jgi:hypothetical protein
VNTKLTLRLDEKTIRGAKAYAHHEGKSVSQVVADYFRLIAGVGRAVPRRTRGYGPLTTQLYGSLKGRRVSESDYRKHLEEKYR